MQYAIHTKLGTSVGPRLDDRFHASISEARWWLKQQLDDRNPRLPGTESQYTIEPYDDKGFWLQKMEGAELDHVVARSTDLVHQDLILSSAVSAMLAGRQLYVVGYQEMTRRLCELREHENQDVPEGVADVLAQSAANKAEQQFEPLDVAVGLGSATGWLQAISERDIMENKMAEAKDTNAREKKRRESLIDLPFMPSRGMHGGWQRDRSIIFVGQQDAVTYTMNRICHFLANPFESRKHRYQVLRFTFEVDQAAPGKLVQVAPEAWHNCCKTAGSLKALLETCNQELGAPADVIMVDDLAEASYRVGTGYNTLVCASKAHRRLHRVAKQVGACLLGGVVVPHLKPNTLVGIHAERLRTFSTVRPVYLEQNDAGDVDYRVGRDVFIEPADSQYLPKSKIITDLE